MSKSKKSTNSVAGLYCALAMIARGRPSQRLPGDLFVPAEDDVEFLLANGAIREATDAELALWEKTGGAVEAAAPTESKAAAADDGAGDLA